jgi:hypothetical protein
MSYWGADFGHQSRRKAGRPMGPDAPHYPNKAERKLLVKLMQASGMTAAEVRAVKENRQALAKAAKEPMLSGDTNRFMLKVKRNARTIALARNVPIWEAQKIAKKELLERVQLRPWTRL